MNDSNLKYQIIYDIISAEDNVLNVKELCEVAGVSRSGYYAWVNAEPNRIKRELQDQKDFNLILEAFQYRGYDKGVRGIHMRLLHTGVLMNQKKIRRLMRKYNLSCPVRRQNPYRQMIRAMKTNSISDNLVNREFKEHGPRTILLTDITYIRLNNEFVYLSVILDAFTKEVLSYVLSESLEIDFVLQTVNLLIQKHGSLLNSSTIIHSDQGSHYTSIKFRQLIDDFGLRQSMSRRGNCWDNAPQESFFGHMKAELKPYISNWTTLTEAKQAIDDWMDYYNNERYQWDLAKLSTVQFYEYYTTGIYPLEKQNACLASD